MYKYIFLLLISIVFSTPSFSQTSNVIIDNIKKEFTVINNDTGLKRVLIVEDEFKTGTDRGGELTGYYKNNKLVKIRAWVGISNGFYITEYYLKNNTLIFAYRIFNTFIYDEKNNDFDESRVERQFEGRYYFNNKKLIDKLTIGESKYTVDAKVLLTEANDYMLLLNKKHK